MTRSRMLRAALSAFLVFHLFAITLAPNSQSYLGGRMAFWVYPYLSFLELASQWGFFAPDPGPPPVFIEYELVGAEGQILKAGTWPERPAQGEPFFLRERQNRRISVARFLIAAKGRTEKTMGPYFCQVDPRAQSVRLWHVIETLPVLDLVVEGKRRPGDGVDTKRQWITQYLCGERA